VFLTDVRIPASNIVGVRGEGWRVANVTLKYERGMIGNAGQGESGIKALVELLQEASPTGDRAMDLDHYRDRLLKLQGRALANKYHGMRLLSQAALLGFLATSSVSFALALVGPVPLPLFLTLFALAMFQFPWIGSNFNAMAMEHLGHVAGMASSSVKSMASERPRSLMDLSLPTRIGCAPS